MGHERWLDPMSGFWKEIGPGRSGQGQKRQFQLSPSRGAPLRRPPSRFSSCIMSAVSASKASIFMKWSKRYFDTAGRIKMIELTLPHLVGNDRPHHQLHGAEHRVD